MQTLSGVRAELDNTKTEHDTIRKKLEKTTEMEFKGETLQAELDALRAEFKKCASVAAQCEAAEQAQQALGSPDGDVEQAINSLLSGTEAYADPQAPAAPQIQ